jgi:hypothetical protein
VWQQSSDVSTRLLASSNHFGHARPVPHPKGAARFVACTIHTIRFKRYTTDTVQALSIVIILI